MDNLDSLIERKNTVVTVRKKRRQSTLEQELWNFLEHYAKSWVYPDCPRSWSTNISRGLGYHDGWFSSVRKKNTSVCVSTIQEVCTYLNELRPSTAPKITSAAAFLGAERRMNNGREGVICLQLPLVDQVALARKAKNAGKTINDYTRDLLLNETRREMLK